MSESVRARTRPELPLWPAGDSEMANRVRSFNWAATPLGPIDQWPQSLKTAVDICLGSAFAAWVDWGRDLVQIYNDAAIAILGGKHPHALGAPARRNWADVWQVTGPLIEGVLATGRATRVDDLAMMPERGGPREAAHFALSLSPLRDERGEIAGLFVTAIETTARVNAEAARLAGEQRLQRVLETDAVGVIFFDHSGTIIDANEAFLRMTGYSRHEVNSRTLTWRTMTPPEWVAVSEQQMANLAATGRIGPYEKEYFLKDGSRRWMLFTGRDLVDGTISEYCIDITDRKRAELALQERDEQLRLALRAAGAGIAGLDLATGIGWTTPEWRDVTGFEEMPAPESFDRFLALVHREDRDRVAALHAEAARQGTGLQFEFRINHPTRGERWLQSHSIQIPARGGGPGHLIGVSLDITERKRAEQRLRESEARLRKVLDIETVGVVYFDLAGGIHGANDAFLRMIGYTREELEAGQIRYENLTPADWRWRDGQTIADLKASGEAGPSEKEYTHKNGSRVWILCSSKMLDEHTAVEFVNDLTERKRAAAHLRESEERQTFLLKLSDALRPIADPVAVQETASRMTAEHLDIGRVAYCEICYEPDIIVIVERDWPRRGMPSIAAGRYRMDDFGPFLAKELTAGRPAIVADALTDSRLTPAELDNWKAFEIVSNCAIPVMKEGRFVAYLVAQDNRRHDWTDQEIDLLREVSERIWAAVERARAEAALAASEAEYRSLFETMGQGYCLLELVRDETGRAVDQLYLELNPAFERLFGIAVAEAKGRKASEVFPFVDPIWHERFDEVASTGTYKRFEHQHGPLHPWFEVFVYPRGGDRVVVLYEEITDRKRAEIALRASEERQAFLLALGDAMRAEPAADGKIAIAARLLGETLNASRVLYAEYDHERGLAYIFNGWLADGAQPFPPVVKLADFEGAVLNHLREGRVVRVDDVGRLSAESGYAAIANAGVQALLSPPLLVDGKLRFNVSIHQHEPRHWSDDEVALVQEVSERLWAEIVRARAEQALRDSEERFRQFGESSTDALWIRDAVTLRMEYVSPAFEAIYGETRDRVVDQEPQSWLDLIVPEDRQLAMDKLEQVRRGERVAFEFRIRRPSDGEERWVRNIDFPLRDESGQVQRIGGIGQDITEQKRTAAHMEMMVAELQHRTRNLLTVVRSLAGQTLKSSSSLEDFKDRFDDRLSALSRVQGLLSRADQERITIGALISMEFDALAGEGLRERISLLGPDVRLRHSVVQTLALALHELATNARKYGALASPHGRLTVTWRIVLRDDGERRLVLEWVEQGTDMARREDERRSARRGYGRELIERALPYTLGAETRFAFSETGVNCIIDLPLDRTGKQEAK